MYYLSTWKCCRWYDLQAVYPVTVQSSLIGLTLWSTICSPCSIVRQYCHDVVILHQQSDKTSVWNFGSASIYLQMSSKMEWKQWHITSWQHKKKPCDHGRLRGRPLLRNPWVAYSQENVITYFERASCSDGSNHTTASTESLSDGIVTCMGRWSSWRKIWIVNLERDWQNKNLDTYTIKSTTELAFKKAGIFLEQRKDEWMQWLGGIRVGLAMRSFFRSFLRLTLDTYL